MNRPTLILIACLLSTVAQAGRQSEGVTLERARHLFSQIDTDVDGLISAVEAGRSKIPSRDFVSSDFNRDRRLSGEEFLVFYRRLAVKGGKTVDPSLEAEVIRIEAARKAKEAADAKKREDDERAAAARRAAKLASDRARAQAIREDPVAREARRREAARRRKLAGDKDIDAREETWGPDGGRRSGKVQVQRVRELAAKTDIQAELARLEKSIRELEHSSEGPEEQRAQRIAEARRLVQELEAERQHRARVKAMTPEELAKLYVQRMVELGHLSSQDARDLYLVLGEGKKKIIDAATMRSILARVRPRIGDLVRSGALTAEGGRALSTTLDQRARAVLDSSNPPADPETDRRQRRPDKKSGVDLRKVQKNQARRTSGAGGSGRSRDG